MSDTDPIFQRWLNGEWSNTERDVILVASALAHAANEHRRWWQFRRRSPTEFISLARFIVGYWKDGIIGGRPASRAEGNDR